jgi:hypothetical protein
MKRSSRWAVGVLQPGLGLQDIARTVVLRSRRHCVAEGLGLPESPVKCL